jgi:mannosyltransferase OCH1-like enzyme
MIEKNIYQTYFTKNLPDPIYNIINRHISQNPTYRYHFFDDTEIIDFINSTFDTDIIKAYNALQIGAAKADFWRYLILYKNGGAYIDIDSCFNFPLDTILKDTDNALISRENNPDKFVQWGLFFAKNHPVLETVIEYVTNSILKCIADKQIVRDDLVLLELTGPAIFSRAIEDHYKYLNINKSVYDCSDLELETVITVDKKDYARFLGVDYNGLCSFKHPYNHFLYEPYIQKKSWRDELKDTPLIKF